MAASVCGRMQAGAWQGPSVASSSQRLGQSACGRPQHARSLVAHAGPPYTIKTPQGDALQIDKDVASVGTSPDCDVRISGAKAAAQHAQIERKGRQLFFKALVGESMLDSSLTWLDGTELRPRVAYVLGSGAKLTFGEPGGPDKAWEVMFAEAQSSNPMMEMMFDGMAKRYGGPEGGEGAAAKK